jgi:hypothetical protein
MRWQLTAALFASDQSDGGDEWNVIKKETSSAATALMTLVKERASVASASLIT